MLVLRKKKAKSLEELTLSELLIITLHEKDLFNRTGDYIELDICYKIIADIKDDIYRSLDLSINSDWNICHKILLNVDKNDQLFRVNFLKHLINSNELLCGMKFTQVTFANINYWVCTKTSIHGSFTKYNKEHYCINYYGINNVLYTYRNNKWQHKISGYTTELFNHYKNATDTIELLYYIMIINTFDLNDDIKCYIKLFYRNDLNPNVKFI